jgi:YVTN family beta-propeller protein
VGGIPSWTASSSSHVWTASTSTGQVAVIDATSRKVVKTVAVGGKPVDGDVVDGVAWFPDRDTTEVVGVDATGALVGRHGTGLADPFVLSAYAGRLWVGDFGGTDLLGLTP